MGVRPAAGATRSVTTNGSRRTSVRSWWTTAIPVTRRIPSRPAVFEWTIATACSPAETADRLSCPATRLRASCSSGCATRTPIGGCPRKGNRSTAEEIATLDSWIGPRAPWPPIKVPASLGKPNDWYEPLKKEHWAWQPLTEPCVADGERACMAKGRLDRFILAGLDKAGLKPVGDADRLGFAAPSDFDLTGLPPTPAEIDAFLKDTASDALRAVRRPLARLAQFGERWGRHWLDVARYGESTGPSRNIPYPHAWQYRNYVIDAVNADVPFDRFVAEQIAGDLLAGDLAEQEREPAADRDGLPGAGSQGCEPAVQGAIRDGQRRRPDRRRLPLDSRR